MKKAVFTTNPITGIEYYHGFLEVGQKYTVWDVHLNRNTNNWGGSEWVVDGERGRYCYPGYWDKEAAVRYYEDGE